MKKYSFLLLIILFSQIVFSQIKITQTGIVGFFNETPAHPVQISNSRVHFNFNSSYPFQISLANQDPRLLSQNKIVFYNLTNTGYIDIEARTVYQYSDEKAKTNIQKITDQKESPLTKILKLSGYSYDWKEDIENNKTKRNINTNKQIGFLAQQLEEVIPEAVITADSTGAKMISYQQIIPLLVEAIKEQQTTIEDLKNQLNATKIIAIKE